MAAAAAVFGWLAQMMMLFAAIFLHELCHVLAARAYGLRMAEIELMPFGGVSRMEGVEMSPKMELITAAAGPAFNLVIALSLIALARFIPSTLGATNSFAKMNLALALFNLLPALPLDGGRILRAALSKKLGSKRATDVAFGMGVVFSLILLALGIWMAVQGEINFAPFGIAIIIFAGAFTERKKATLIVIKDMSSKRTRMMEGRVLHAEHLAANKDTRLIQVVKAMSPGKYHAVTVLDEKCGAIGELAEDEILAGMVEYGQNTSLGALLKKMGKK
ncbi:MAG: M50 family metallopeptidase [Bacillota bacterium]|nr:M50 family metallopeptidase [Bacillota bacterium]